MKKALLYCGIAIILLTFISVDNVWGKDKEKDKQIINNNTFTTINKTDSKLEETAYCIRGELQFIRKENLTVGIYGKSDLRHNNNEVGINVVIGLGKSESQIKREKLEKRIENLEKIIQKERNIK